MTDESLRRLLSNGCSALTAMADMLEAGADILDELDYSESDRDSARVLIAARFRREANRARKIARDTERALERPA